MSRKALWARAIPAALLCTSLALCQDPTGILEGQITDPSGAVVPKARVTISNSSNGFSTLQESSGTGGFRFSYLPVGNYRLQVSLKGFTTFDATGIHVDVNRVVNVPVNLRLAGSKDTVDISAIAETVDVSSTLGN